MSLYFSFENELRLLAQIASEAFLKIKNVDFNTKVDF